MISIKGHNLLHACVRLSCVRCLLCGLFALLSVMRRLYHLLAVALLLFSSSRLLGRGSKFLLTLRYLYHFHLHGAGDSMQHVERLLTCRCTGTWHQHAIAAQSKPQCVNSEGRSAHLLLLFLAWVYGVRLVYLQSTSNIVRPLLTRGSPSCNEEA